MLFRTNFSHILSFSLKLKQKKEGRNDPLEQLMMTNQSLLTDTIVVNHKPLWKLFRRRTKTLGGDGKFFPKNIEKVKSKSSAYHLTRTS